MKNRFLITAFLFVGLISLISAQTYPLGCGMWGMMGGTYGYGIWWLFSWLFGILVLVALVLLIFWLVRQIQNPQKTRTK